MQIGIIGIGNIGGAICRGLSKTKGIKILAYDSNEENRRMASNLNLVEILHGSLEVVKSSDVIILCIRTDQTLNWVKKHYYELKSKLIILVQSGLSIQDLADFKLLNVIRLITNINVSENLGHTVVLQNYCENFNKAVTIFNNLGNVLIVDSEEELNQMSLITGCTPAISAMFAYGLEKCYGGSHALLIDVVSDSLKVLKATGFKPNEYAKTTYSKGGVFEKCVLNIGDKSEFQNSIINWIKPLNKKLE